MRVSVSDTFRPPDLKEFRMSPTFSINVAKHPNGTPLLVKGVKGGVAAPIKKSGEASLAGADGVVRNHPGRAFQRNGAVYLMARPPLLCQVFAKEGSSIQMLRDISGS